MICFLEDHRWLCKEWVSSEVGNRETHHGEDVATVQMKNEKKSRLWRWEKPMRDPLGGCTEEVDHEERVLATMEEGLQAGPSISALSGHCAHQGCAGENGKEGLMVNSGRRQVSLRDLRVFGEGGCL